MTLLTVATVIKVISVDYIKLRNTHTHYKGDFCIALVTEYRHYTDHFCERGHRQPFDHGLEHKILYRATPTGGWVCAGRPEGRQGGSIRFEFARGEGRDKGGA